MGESDPLGEIRRLLACGVPESAIMDAIGTCNGVLLAAEEQGHIRDPEVKVLPDAEMPEERTYTLKGQFADDPA